MSITRPENGWRRPLARMRTPHANGGQRGFSIVAAIFILVVLAGLGGFIVSTSSTQHLSLALDAMNSRAQQAARAGVEWGGYQVVNQPAGGFAVGCNANSYASAGHSVSPALSGIPGLSEFTVEVNCVSDVFSEGSPYRVYQLTATACNQPACPSTAPGLGYVEHRQRARVKMP